MDEHDVWTARGRTRSLLGSRSTQSLVTSAIKRSIVAYSLRLVSFGLYLKERKAVHIQARGRPYKAIRKSAFLRWKGRHVVVQSLSYLILTALYK